MANELSDQNQGAPLQNYAIEIEESGSPFVKLKWTYFDQPDRTMFAEIVLASQPPDVTLECVDGIIKSHKVILHACSAFFREKLDKNSCIHQHVAMTGIGRIKELYAVLHFIYFGHVHIRHYDIYQFLNAARFLQIDGMYFQRDYSNYIHSPAIGASAEMNLYASTAAMYGNEWRNNSASKPMLQDQNSHRVSSATAPANPDAQFNKIPNSTSINYVAPNSERAWETTLRSLSNHGLSPIAANVALPRANYCQVPLSDNNPKDPTLPKTNDRLESNSGSSQFNGLSAPLNYPNFTNASTTLAKSFQNAPLYSPATITPLYTPQVFRPVSIIGPFSTARNSPALKGSLLTEFAPRKTSRFQPYAETVTTKSLNSDSAMHNSEMHKTFSDYYAEKYGVGPEKISLPSTSYVTPRKQKNVKQGRKNPRKNGVGKQGTGQNTNQKSFDSSHEVLPPLWQPAKQPELPDETKTGQEIQSSQLLWENKEYE